MSVMPTQNSDDVAMGLKTLRDALGFFIRQPSPRILMFASAAFLIARTVVGRWRLADAFVALAVAASWHLQERLLHEYVLHRGARRFLSSALLNRLSKTHRQHHRDPWHSRTLFIATGAYAFSLPSVVGALFVLTRDLGLTLTGSFAYFSTLLYYEWTHLLIHTAHVPRSEWFRRRWWNHRLHHFKNNRYWFGITSPMWDTILGTRPDPSVIAARKDWRGPNPLEAVLDAPSVVGR